MVYFKKDNQDYIFVHIPKTAGISVTEALLNDIDNSEYLRITGFESICKSKITKFYDHIPAWYINKLLVIKKVNYITIVRNPWARMFSLFQHTMMRKSSESNNFESNLILDTRYEFSNSFVDQSLNELNKIGSKNTQEAFKFWLYFIGRNKKLIPQNNPNFNVLPQHWWLFSEENSIQSYKIFKYESLKELEEFFNLKLIPTNKNKLKSNETYKYAYTQDTVEYVANLDKWIIDKCGYKFE